MSGDMYKVNLLPPKLQREELVDVRRLLLLLGPAILVVVIIGSAFFFVFSYFTMRTSIAAATQQLTALQPTVSTVENMRTERTSMQSVVADYKALLQKQITWSSLLYELDDIAPVDVWLVELDIVNAPQPAAQTGKAASAKTAAPASPSTAPAPATSTPAPASAPASSSPAQTGAPATSTPAQASAPASSSSAQTSAAKPPASASADAKKGQAAEPWPRPNTVTIKGYARTVPAIGIFEKNLQQLPYFKDVVIKSINSQPAGNSFEITAYIKDEISG